MTNYKSRFFIVFTLLIFFVKCSKDSDSVDENSIVSSSLSNEDINLALKIHNDARSEVGVPALSWSSSLSEDALQWAIEMAEKDEMFHSTNDSRPGQGENLYYWCCSTGEIETFSSTPGKDASVLWYNEINDYTYAEVGSPLNESVMIGHYTQMVWSSTTEVGMAKARSASGKEYVVARYSPAGNWVGEFPY